MSEDEIFDGVVPRGTTDFRKVIGACAQSGPYCLIGGLAINAYVDPVYTADADLVVKADKLESVCAKLRSEGFEIEEFEHSTNAIFPGSQLRIQFTKSAAYAPFCSRSIEKTVFGGPVQVACLEDLIQGKIWSWESSERRLSKRMKDQTDLIRIAEQFPEIIRLLPSELRRLISAL